MITKLPGARSFLNDPTDESDNISETPNCLSASILAR